MFGDDVAVLAQGIRAHRCYAVAKDEWLVLTASSLVGLARGALDLGVGYVTERRQFDRPIGSFQSVAHRLADAATRVDGARLLAQEAAYAGDQRTDSASTLASMAFAFAAETARAVTTEALHFHGGYGYMMEYDIQMYFRRAMALALLAGGVGASYQRVVESLRRTDDLPIRLETSVQAEAFRKEARAFVEEHVTPEICEAAHQSGTYHCWELHRALGEQGWLAGAWPLEEGGQGRDSLDMLVLQEELQRVAAPVDGWSVTWSAAEAIRAFGSPALKAAVLPDVLAGKRLIALGFSEPDAGSDVAAARTRAVQDGDTWIINGQKMFTTLAHESDWVFLLARTNLAAAKHRGLTLFLVPTSAAGLSLHPVHTLGGERTNITFFNDVCVPDELRVGEIDAGWAVLTRALNVERGSAVGPGPVFLGTLRYMVTTAMRWARGDRLQSPLEMDGRVGDLLARACIQLAVSELLIRRGVVTTSQHPDVEAAMSKLFITEAIQALAPPLLDMCGADGLLDSGAANAPGDGELERLFRHSVVTTIYGGSSEIMREIIGRRRLNLPI
jgi:alkylation response protein AidB-like acyl-CoA dehydrogenase